MLALVDGAAMAVAAFAAGAGRPVAALGAAAVTVAAGAVSGGLYRHRHVLSALDDAGAMLIPALVAGMLVAFAFLDNPWTPLADSCAIGFWLALLYYATALTGRSVCYAAVRAWRRRHKAPPSTLVIGGGSFTGHVLDMLRRHTELGLKPVGRIHPSGTVPPQEASGPVLGGLPDLRRVIRTRGVTSVVIVGEEVPRRHVEVVARLCGTLGCEVLLVPSTVELLSGARGRAEHLCGIPCVSLAHGPHGRPTWYAKRAFDVVAAALALAVVWPVMVACAIAVRIEGGPGVLFRQRRVGMGGKTFVLLKFRTLKPADEKEADTRWSVEGDERMGRIGSFLRRTSLDELPQLWNVLRGDMSLVGPRPERPYFVERFSNEFSGYAMRHRVPVGITGWAQVHGLRGDTSIALRARFDNHYIDNWSFWGDLKILLLTIQAVFMVKAP
ncbi:MAG: sugar transferase [Actinomadura rubrobrunea]|nr:sugar transferase [Actinomadura rubrobrunea]